MGLTSFGLARMSLYLLGGLTSIGFVGVVFSPICLPDRDNDPSQGFLCSFRQPDRNFNWVAYPLVFGFLLQALYNTVMFGIHVVANSFSRRRFTPAQLHVERLLNILLFLAQAAVLGFATWYLTQSNLPVGRTIAGLITGWLAVASSFALLFVFDKRDYKRGKRDSQDEAPVSFPGEADQPDVESGQQPRQAARRGEDDPGRPALNDTLRHQQKARSESGWTDVGGSAFLSVPAPKPYDRILNPQGSDDIDDDDEDSSSGSGSWEELKATPQTGRPYQADSSSNHSNRGQQDRSSYNFDAEETFHGPAAGVFEAQLH